MATVYPVVFQVANALCLRVACARARCNQFCANVIQSCTSARYLALIALLAKRRDPKPPLAVSVTLTHLIERSGTSGSLFTDAKENAALTQLIDRINGRYGNNKIFFGGAHEAMSSAPMRIAFNRIPDARREDEVENNEHWLKRLRQAKVLAEAEHRKADRHHRIR